MTSVSIPETLANTSDIKRSLRTATSTQPGPSSCHHDCLIHRRCNQRELKPLRDWHPTGFVSYNERDATYCLCLQLQLPTILPQILLRKSGLRLCNLRIVRCWITGAKVFKCLDTTTTSLNWRPSQSYMLMRLSCERNINEHKAVISWMMS